MLAAATSAYSASMYSTIQSESQSLAVLLIVENSQTVLETWPDLAHQYLGSIAAKLSTSATDNIRYFLMESSTQQELPREYLSIQDAWSQLRFDPNPKNRLSFNKVWSGVDFFACAAFPPHVSRHIIIVAASPPLEDNASVRPVNLTHWHTLAQQLTQASMKCHMILSPIQSMVPFVALFDKSVSSIQYDIPDRHLTRLRPNYGNSKFQLELQGGYEDQFPIPFDEQKIMIKLTTTRTRTEPTASGNPHAASMPTSQSSLQRRTNSFPSDLYLMNQRMQHSGEHFGAPLYPQAEPAPSLVSQLQQVHGLTKKKVYSAKPVRKPFFKDERFSQESNDVSSLLPLTNSGGRVPSLSKVDRAVRIAQAGSPTESYPRRPGLPRRGSGLSSSPDLPHPVSPMSQTPSNPSPTSPIFDAYPAHSMMPPTSQMHADPSWLQPSYQNTQTHYSYSDYGTIPESVPPSIPNVATASHRVNMGSQNQYPQTNARRPTSPPAPSPKRPRRSLCPEDDEPFTFDASYVAATVELWENEVLPAYPDVPSMKPSAMPIAGKAKADSPRPRSSRNTFYIPEGVADTPGTAMPDTSNGGSHDIYATNHLSTPLHYPASANNLNYMNAYPSGGSSSSLIGWAG